MKNAGKTPYYIQLRSPQLADEWDDFVTYHSDEAWLWHLYDFQDVMVDRGLKDLSFGVRSSATGDLLAVVPLHLRRRKELGIISWFTAHSHGSPALRDGVGEKQRIQISAAIRTHIQETAGEHHITEITFSAAPAAPAYRGTRCPRINPLILYDYESIPDQVWMLPLDSEMDKIRRSYSYQTRSDLRKAHNYTIYEAQDSHDLATYYELHLETCQRTGDQPHPLEYFRTTFDRFLPTGRCRILFFVQEGRVMAAQCTGVFKGGANYWFGASRTDKPQHGGENRILFDLQFERARHDKVEWYFVGSALTKGKLAGISEFKASFGSQLYPYFRARLVINIAHWRFFRHLHLLRGYSE